MLKYFEFGFDLISPLVFLEYYLVTLAGIDRDDKIYLIATDLIEVAYTNIDMLNFKYSEISAGAYVLSKMIDEHKRKIFEMDFGEKK